MIAQLTQQGTIFCARLPHSWSETKRVGRASVADQVCECGSAEAPFPLRILPNGTVLVLATNLMGAGITSEDFAALYYGRWRIEEHFKLIHERLMRSVLKGIDDTPLGLKGGSDSNQRVIWSSPHKCIFGCSRRRGFGCGPRRNSGGNNGNRWCWSGGRCYVSVRPTSS